MNKVRIGLVGCGGRGISVTTLFRIHPQCEVTACCDIYEACATRAAERFQIPARFVYTNYEKMLREAPVDAVFLAPDPMVQVAMACQAMQAGKHVCTEVPAAFTLEECWKLIETVECTGMKYQLMEQTRYWGFVQTWKQMVDRGELGHVCLAQGEYVHYEEHWGCWTDTETGDILPSNERPRDRDVLPHWRYLLLSDPIYYLPHTLSPLLSILGDRVLSVACMGTRKQSYTQQGLPWCDIQYALMHTEKDTILLAGAGFSLPHVPRGATYCHWYELRGTDGSVCSPRCYSEPFRVWRRGMSDFEAMSLSTIPLGADQEQAQTGHGGADYCPVDTFIKSIIEDTTPPLDVYLTAELTAPAIVAAESARSGGALLKVPDFRRR